MSDRLRYYDPDGNPITMEEWAVLFERRKEPDTSWWSRRTRVTPEVEVSTVWLGLNHAWGCGPPLTWETMIFGGEHDQYQDRYTTKEQAFEGHERVVKALQVGEDPSE